MNILNILILLFILGMAYWWSTQGMFSALMHLVAVIVAGALSFALWEVISLDLLMKYTSPRFAWPVGLLGPFMILLFVVRMVLDKTVRGNVHFAHIINMIAGGFLGVLSGILTAGITVLGISFLPMGPSLAGYQPFSVNDTGGIEGNVGDGLMIPVDKHAASFFSMLSNGAFSPHGNQRMRLYQPELATQAALYRMSYDPNASPVASPEKLSIRSYHTAPTPLTVVDDSIRSLLGDQARIAGNQLILIDTVWQQLPGMFDGDSTLRVSPPQIRLVVTTSEGDVRLVAPVAASQGSEGNRQFVAFNDNRSFVWGDGQEVNLAWMFLISAEDRPRFLLARHLRLALPDEAGQPSEIMALAGTARATNLVNVTGEGEAPTVGDTTGVASGQKVLNIVIDNKLPLQISKNLVQGFEFDGSSIVRGDGLARKLNTHTSREVMVDSIATPAHRATLKVQIDRQQANSLFGASRVAAASLGGIWLEDNQKDKWYPIGYVLHKANGDQQIKVDMGAPIQSARQLPINQIDNGDAFYVYFSVSRGRTITSYHAGSQSTEINLTIPAQ